MHANPFDDSPSRLDSGHGKHLLYVKDRTLGAAACPPAFRRTGFRVSVLPDYRLAYDRVADCDVLLLELGRRSDWAFDLIDHVRNRLQLDRIPLLVLAVDADAAAIARCHEMESTHFRCFTGGSPMRVVRTSLQMLDPTCRWTPPSPPEGVVIIAHTEPAFRRSTHSASQTPPLTGLTFGRTDQDAA